jgi:DNA adenine methylase
VGRSVGALLAAVDCRNGERVIDQTVKPSRPVLRYHGGKWKLADWIIGNFGKHRVYVEPFGGAGSVLMRKPRAKAEMINDLDGEIVNLFRVLRDPSQARELERLIRLTPYARSEFEAAYLSAGDPIEQARRTVLRSFAGFGTDGVTAATGFRENLMRNGGSPANDWQNYPDAIPAMTERLRGVVVESRPAVQLIQKHDSPTTLFYCDPPYPHETRAGWVKRKHSYRFEMSSDEHRELAEVLMEAKGAVVISGYPCELYDRELFSGWHRIERKTMADGARERTEVLWLNATAAHAQQRNLFNQETA